MTNETKGDDRLKQAAKMSATTSRKHILLKREVVCFMISYLKLLKIPKEAGMASDKYCGIRSWQS